MFQRKLVIFVLVGTISGLILGSYLLDYKKSSQLEFVEGPSVSVVTDKTDYKKGETITITIVNSGTVPIKFDDSSYGLTVKGLEGFTLYKPKSETGDYKLESREEVSFQWNQVKDNGENLLEGVYKINTEGMTGDSKIKRTITVNIWK